MKTWVHYLFCLLVILSINCSKPTQVSTDEGNEDFGITSDMYTNTFGLTISNELFTKWGCQFPATFIFSVEDTVKNLEVLYKTLIADAWKALPKKNSSELFNGIDAVRLDTLAKKVYVSIGFKSRNKLYIQFKNVQNVTFESVAKYYDNRKAAYTLSMDNWGNYDNAYPGIACKSITDTAGDKFQAALMVVRNYKLSVSAAINTDKFGGDKMFKLIQGELNKKDFCLEPAVHSRHHPNSAPEYVSLGGYDNEILGCRDDLLRNLTSIPYGNYIFEFILPTGVKNTIIEQTSKGEFLFLRDWRGKDNTESTQYASWNTANEFYGIGGLETVSYDLALENRSPKAVYFKADVDAFNTAFATVYTNGGIFYAMWHPNRYVNNIINDTTSAVSEGKTGSSLMQHFKFVSKRTDVWYVANGWLYLYKLIADNTTVKKITPSYMASTHSHE